ncbi:MAG: 50S ribosomal protein L25 [Candidatus Nomurabacteria bacterium]|jgi:large subunit ribosomal protein L25|nr:50S ribosomal protein L25 [Candidatus Nomurabacteria bacterium]
MSSDKISLVVTKRQAVGKAVAELRRQEIVPAVVYGKDFAPLSIQAPYLDVQRTIRAAGTHSPVELTIDGQKQAAIIKAIDIDHVKNRISHISFQAVSADQIVTTEVPIEIVAFDESEAAKAGLEVMQSVEAIEIKAKPADLPEKLEVSAAAAKEHGDKLTVADIQLPAGVTLADSDETELTIASVIDPAIEAAKAEAAEKAAAEAEAAKAPAAEEPAATAETEADKPAETEAKAE